MSSNPLFCARAKHVTDVFCVLQYDNIDAEHKAIFECIFNCAKDPSSAPLVTKLYDVTADHFKDEEVCTVYIGYCSNEI